MSTQATTAAKLVPARQYRPRAVMCIHGIRTHAKWQKDAGEIFSVNLIPSCPYDFGKYGLHRFLFSFFNDRMVERFYRYYDEKVHEGDLKLNPENPAKRPSVIAHSFGTYIVGYCMLKRKDVRFDKVILCGSILPVDFDWITLFKRGQVNFVRNEYGTNDVWARNVKKFVSKTGSSGFEPFHYDGLRLEQECFPGYAHSDYFERGHIENNWLPFLRRSPFVPLQVR